MFLTVLKKNGSKLNFNEFLKTNFDLNIDQFWLQMCQMTCYEWNYNIHSYFASDRMFQTEWQAVENRLFQCYKVL